MSTLLPLKLLIAFLMLAGFPAFAQAPQAAAPRQSFRTGPAVFQQNCGTCHAADIGKLQQYSPESVYEALTTGKMKAEAANLTEAQRRLISEFLAARPAGAEAGDMKNMTNRCAANPAMTDPASGPAWNGWSAGSGNARFQSTAAAGITAQQVPGLKLKWAFGVPNAVEMYSQPTVVSGRVFMGSDASVLYSLDAKTGCAYWSFQADSGIRSAPTVAPIRGQGATRYAVYFVDVLTRVYALDAQTGRLLWKVRAGDHPRAKSSATPAVHDGRIYVPISSMETTTGAVLTYECCTFRGHVVALDAGTGRRIWRTFVIQEEPKPKGKNKQGVALWAPSGGSVWNSPTVDAKRKRVYVGTGNAYSSPAAAGTDSVIAMDMDSGKIVWQHQEYKDDAFINNCRATGEPGGNCPETLGPDYDFGGASMILHTLPNGRDVLVAGSKGGVALALDLDRNGAVVWRTNLAERPPGAAGLIVFGGASDGTNVYYALHQPGGSIAAVQLSDGARKWTTPAFSADRRGQQGAVTGIPGVVFGGTLDGTLHALSTTDGRVIWEYNTAHEYETVNGVPARGGALGQPGVTVAGGMLFLTSGYFGGGSAAAGNVLLAFGPE